MFMDVMQELINDESIAIIEVNYYHTGGCYLSLYDSSEQRTGSSYEFSKPANKSNRLSGEMGYLESNNPHIKIHRSNLHSRDTYEIIKTSAPFPATEKSYFESPYVSKHEGNINPIENVLEVFEYELSQPQVTSAVLEKKDKDFPTLTLTSGHPKEATLGKETVIKLDPKNYGEAIRFIVKNNENLFKKYSLNFVPHVGKTLEETPVVVYRNHEYSDTLISEKQPVSKDSVIPDIIEFLKRQIDDNDVELFYIEKMEISGVETVKIELTSGASVKFLANDGDLAKVEDYADKNNTHIEAEGFWTLGQTQHGSGNRRMFKIRAFPMFENSKDGTKTIRNVKRFVMRGLQQDSLFRASLYAPYSVGEKGTAVEFSSNDLRFSYEIDASQEVFAAVCEILEAKKETLEKKYNVNIRLYADNKSIQFQKKYRVDYRKLIGYETLTEEMFEFLSEAYRAGINIMVQGNTGSGKTTFIRALYEGANDTKVTALLDENSELLFPDTMDNFIALRGSNDNIASTALKISPARVVVDDLRLRYSKIADFMEKCVKANIQMISSMHGSIERIAECKDGFVIPFEIEVELIRGKVKAINQVIVSGQKVEKNVLWKFENDEFLKLNIASRTLRRKIAQNLEKAAKETSDVKEPTTLSTAKPLVTISEQEKEELMEAMKTIQKFMGRF